MECGKSVKSCENRQTKPRTLDPTSENLHAKRRLLCELSGITRKQTKAVLERSRVLSRTLREELARSDDDLWRSHHRENGPNPAMNASTTPATRRLP